MKKSFLFILFAVTCNIIGAQTMISADNSHPLKFDDLLTQYQKYKAENYDEPETNNNKDPAEGMDLLFNRQIAYAKRHLDENGYIVSPLKTISE